MSPAIPGTGAGPLSTLPSIVSGWGRERTPGTGVGLWYLNSCLKALCLPSVASLRLSAAANGFWLWHRDLVRRQHCSLCWDHLTHSPN